MKKIGILAFFIGVGGVHQYLQSQLDALSLDDRYTYVLFTEKGNMDYEDSRFEQRKVDILGNSDFLKRLLQRLLGIKLINLLMILGIPKPFFFSSEEIEVFQDIDLFFSPVPSLYPHYFLGKPYIMTIHDLQEKYYPQFFTLKERISRFFRNRIAIGHCTRIMTESRYVKNDIRTFYNYPDQNISVLPSPPPVQFLDKSFTPEQLNTIREKYSLSENYLFYPAQYWFHKNHITLLEAFKLLIKKYKNLSLVFTGTQQNNYENVVQRIKELDLENRVLQLGYIAYEDLPALYLMSKMLVMPTLFESVSMPVYEAFSLKVPVCCSNVVALPEQIGEAGLLFDPNDPVDMAEKIERLLDDPEFRLKLGEIGYERVKNFDHSHYAANLVVILNDAMHSVNT